MEHDTQVVQQKRNIFSPVANLWNKHKKLTIFGIIILAIIGFFVWRNTIGSSQQPQYQTATVTKGTLISSVAESGTVALANRVEITTQASGVINHVYVKDGDTVTAGQTIADMTLDTDGSQRSAQAWASYLSAKNSLAAAQAQLYGLQSSMYADWQTYMNVATNSTYQNGDGSPNISNRVLTPFTTAQDNWLQAQAQYQNQQGVVAQAQASMNSAWQSYQLTSPTLAAPSAGVITDIVITPGLQITTSTGSNNTISSQPVASIKTQGAPVISVNLSEIDAVKVTSGQKAEVTLDAFPNQTFTGKVTGIDTTGVVSSGVTTYPTTIVLDVPNDKILPNMSATANIITQIKPDVLLVPNAAIQTISGQATVRVLQNGQVTVVPVTTDATSDTQTEIVTGLTEGQTVVTGVISSGAASGATSSPFSSGLRFGGGGGGGAVFINGGGAGGRGGGGGGARGG